MIELSGKRDEEPELRRVIILETLAAAAVMTVMAVVLYMVFTYRPV
jgi:hypothetical protein